MQVVIPVKSLEEAKARLSAVLCAEERKRLARCMLEDVLAALQAATEVTQVFIVTENVSPGGEVYNIADASGAELIPDHAGNLNGALAQAAAQLVTNGAADMLVLPADIPQITAHAIDDLIRAHRACARDGFAVSLVPAEADGGTNALVLSPPNVLAPVFGENSCRRFFDLARDKGVEAKVFHSEEISLDIDRPEDLVCLQAISSRANRRLERVRNTKTQKYLQQIDVFERLPETRRLTKQVDKQVDKLVTRQMI